MAALAVTNPWLLIVLLLIAKASHPSDVWITADSEAIGDAWAIVVCTSRFWHNYRHAANAVSVYGNLRRCALPSVWWWGV